MKNNRVTDLFDIKLPFIGGGMVWMSTAPLVAAVSNAGGLGLLAGGSNSAESLANQIARTRDLTDKPFGVNIPLLWPMAADLVDVIIDMKVPVVFTSAGSPKKFTPKLKAAGVKVVHVVPSSILAAKCEAAGVDAIVAEGAEGGGHVAFDMVNTMILTPMVCAAVSIPVIAAGGIATGRQAAAAFCLGAEGVQVGTRLIATEECEGHINFKQAILDATETGTVVTGRNVEPVRNIRNKLTDALLKPENEGASNEKIIEFVGPGRAQNASIDGDVEWGTVQAGEVVGMINEILPVKTVMESIMGDAERIIKELAARF